MSVTIRPEKNNFIKMTRGDTLLTTVNILNEDGTTYEPAPTDVITFTVKKDYNDKKPLIVKDIPVDTMILRVDSEDTKKLEMPGKYYYDIQITYGDGIVSTFIANAILRITEEVTD